MLDASHEVFEPSVEQNGGFKGTNLNKKEVPRNEQETVEQTFILTEHFFGDIPRHHLFIWL